MTGGTFRNPLWPRNFADPFVLKFNGAYYAYGTPGRGGLPVLRSSDLVTWQDGGQVLGPPEDGLAHWAPEVAYDNGRFFLYYSTGGAEGENHQLRVAQGDSPAGPFDTDLGLLDPDDPFTIDAHPFRDDDGQCYLFYSRDFLEGEPVGTGIVVDKLVDMRTLAGERAVVLRPHAEWHLFERQRRWYDRVWDWYTVEGPFVRKHDGRYWCFYSGGAWKAENYGISSAVAEHPLGPYEPVVAEETADVLRTVPGRVVGPGHGSVQLGPDNLTEYLIYHAWDRQQTGRFLHVDRLLWEGGRPQSPGPRTDPQPCPPEPLFRGLFDPGGGHGQWDLRGSWKPTPGELAHSGGGAHAAALLRVDTPAAYMFEVNLAFAADPGRGRGGVVISYGGDDGHTALFLDPVDRSLRWHVVGDREVRAGGTLGRLRHDFETSAFHQLVVRRHERDAAVALDGVSMGSLPPEALGSGRVGLWTSQAAVTFAGVTLSDLG